tara:strand:- start:1801 stop:2769 length:969 start_codon:yes stop_codon:yes gene_type:complete
MEPVVDTYAKDTLGNRMATVGEGNDPVLMLAGHMDELGFIVSYVDDNGFIYFNPVGGHDRIMIPGRRVRILTKNGDVSGVTGKRAIHLMSPEDRKKIPQIHEMWIDIGASSRDDALKRISLGDAIIYTHGYEPLHGSVGIARGFDNKSGCYVVNEVVRRLAAKKDSLQSKVVAVSTTQEEIGTRGAIPSSFAVNPHFGLAVDVGHATDHPDCDPRKIGKFTLGGGPIVYRGANVNPIVFDRLEACAAKANIPIQIKAEAGPTPTDARAVQMARAGVATGLIGIPLRYMHTPSEVVDLNDVEACVELIRHFALSLQAGERADW